MVIFAFCPANVFKPDKMVMQTYVQVIMLILNIITFIILILNITIMIGGQAEGKQKRALRVLPWQGLGLRACSRWHGKGLPMNQ